MQSIGYHKVDPCSEQKVIAPIVYQQTKTTLVGTGVDDDTFVNILKGECAAYGGEFKNPSCYRLKVTLQYLDGNDCDDCTIETYTVKYITLFVPPQSTLTIPNGYFQQLSYQVVDDAGDPLENDKDFTTEFFSSHVPCCSGCVEALGQIPCGGFGDTGQQTVQNQPGVNGTRLELQLTGMSVTGANIWIWALDNNMDLLVNGESFSTATQLNFFSGTTGAYGPTSCDCRFADGTYINGNSPWSYPASNPEPLIKINISSSGTVSFQGRRSAGVYEEMVLTNGQTFKTVPVFLGCDEINTYEFTQSTLFNPTGATVRLFGL